jgi:hypothetical protein
MKSEAVHYTYGSAQPPVPTVVTSLHLTNEDGTRIAQVSALPDDRAGFLIRVWPVNGTHEYGGDNGTVVSIVVEDDVVTSAHLYE